MINYKTFPNIGYLEVQLSGEELSPIKEEIAEIQKDFNQAREHNAQLVGNLEKEFTLFKSKIHLNNVVFKYLKAYDDETDYTQKINVLTNDCPMIIDDPWVNFQKKYEFNPPHNHTGIVSFVIWIKIPYNIENENATAGSRKAQTPLAGQFSFHYTNVLGKISHHHIPADRFLEGTLLIFPAEMNHSVNPFYTSDDYRISVSGNVKFLTSQDK
jgi:hypothetical protein